MPGVDPVRFFVLRAVLVVVILVFVDFTIIRALFGDGGVKGLCNPLSMWYCLRLRCAVAKLKSSLFGDEDGSTSLGQDLFSVRVTGESLRGEEMGGGCFVNLCCVGVAGDNLRGEDGCFLGVLIGGG